MVSNQQIKRSLEHKKQRLNSENFTCPQCGTENEVHATYCMECGNKLDETVNKGKKRKQKKITADEFLSKRKKDETKHIKTPDDEFNSHQTKRVSFEETEKGAFYSFTGIDENNLASRINSILIAEGYKLESGTILSGDYGKGSHTLRLIGGVLVKRFKFYVNITSEQEKTVLEFSKAMSGFSGGILRVSEMTKEFERLKDLLKSI
jgi:hypothetical protein